MGTDLRAKAAALAGGSAPSTPVVASVSTQTELLKGEAAAQTADSRQCLDLSPGAGTGRPACKRCAQVEDLLQRVAELQEAVRRLRNVREAENGLGSGFQAQSAVHLLPMAKQAKTPLLAHTEGKGANNAEEWKLATARIYRRKRLPLKPEVPWQNCFTTLQTKEGRPVISGEMLQLGKAA